MSFKIKNSEGIAIPINELDKEAAEFWHKEIKQKEYANPTPVFNNPNKLEGRDLAIAELQYIRHESMNWFDLIGYHIHSPRVTCESGWNNTKCSILSVHIESLALHTIEEQLIILKAVNEYVKPYFDLIDHWSNKGYIPVQITE